MPLCVGALAAQSLLGCASEQETHAAASAIEAGAVRNAASSGGVSEQPSRTGGRGGSGGNLSSPSGSGGGQPDGTGGRAGSTGGRGSGGSPIPDSGDEGGDADKPVNAMNCTELQTAWQTFVLTHDGCSTAADCVAFETGDLNFVCDAPAGIRAVLNTNAVDDARAYAKRYSDLACGGDPIDSQRGEWTDYPFDGGPFEDPTCDDLGRCTAVIPSCNADAGRPQPEGGAFLDGSRD